MQTTMQAPDGGWGWMVVLGAFFVRSMLAGYQAFLSVLYVEWSAYFDVTPGEMSWMVFLHPGTSGFVSVIIGKVWDLIGVRRTAIMGATLMVVGCLAGSFATRPMHIAINMGLVSGLGVGFVLISSLNIVTVYFNKRFGLAQGIMSMGTSVSRVCAPPLVHALISRYGWRGTLHIAGALMCHGIAAALLFRPIKQRRIHADKGTSQVHSPPLREGIKNEGFECVQSVEPKERHRSSAASPRASDTRKICTQRVDGNLGCTDEIEQCRICGDENINSSHLCSIKSRSKSDSYEDVALKTFADGRRHSSRSQDCSEIRPSADNANNTVALRTRFQRLGKCLADMFGITVFLNEPLAILQNFSSFVIMMGTFTPVAHVVAMASDQGIDHGRAASLLSVLGVGSFLGRLLAGVLVDKHFIGTHMFMMLVNIFTAIPIFVFPTVIDEFAHAVVTVFFVGVGVGSSIVLRFVQAKEVVEPAFVSDNVRILAMMGGPGMTTGAVLSGWLADITGSYTMSFYFAANIILLAAAISLALVILTRRRRQNRPKFNLEKSSVP